MGNNLCLNMHVLDLSKRKNHVLLINTDYLVIERDTEGQYAGGQTVKLECLAMKAKTARKTNFKYSEDCLVLLQIPHQPDQECAYY